MKRFRIMRSKLTGRVGDCLTEVKRRLSKARSNATKMSKLWLASNITTLYLST